MSTYLGLGGAGLRFFRLVRTCRHLQFEKKNSFEHEKDMASVLFYFFAVCSSLKEYYLNDDAENVHARVYKSARAEVAVVSFRGTQARRFPSFCRVLARAGD